MSEQSIFFAGERERVEHHARPLASVMPVSIVPTAEVVGLTKPGDLVLFSSEHFEPEREAIRQLQEKQVATVYAIDGILEWRNAWENEPHEPACPWTMRPILCDKAACIGASQARTLGQWGNPSSKLELVGVPRFDQIIRRLSKSTLEAGGVSDEKALREEVFTVLVMTAKSPGFTDLQREQIKESLRDLKQWFEANSKYRGCSLKVVWRLTNQLADAMCVPNQLTDVTGKELAEVLPSADAVLTTPSTSQLESMIFGKPTAIVDYTNSPRYVDAAWSISAQSQIDPVMEQLFKPSPLRMFLQNQILADALVADQAATSRMQQLVAAMLGEAATQLAEHERPLSFSTSLVDPISLPRSDFDHEKLFADCEAFRLSDETVLQAELGHARREIGHLNRKISSLQQELAEAHKIFEQIHAHPIAGPVVRTRQRVMDWMAKFSSRNSQASQKVTEEAKPIKS